MCQIANIDEILKDKNLKLEKESRELKSFFQKREKYWNTINKYIISNIKLLLKLEELIYIARIEKAYNIMKRLRIVYKERGYTLRNIHLRVLYRTELKDYKNISEYIETFKKAKILLIEIEFKVLDWIIIINFLYRLLLSFDSFVNIKLKFRGKDDKENLLKSYFDNIYNYLLDRDRR